MLLNKSNICVDLSTNNSTSSSKRHALNCAPNKSKVLFPCESASLTKPANELRSAFRAGTKNFVYLHFRVRRANYEQLLWQLIATGHVKKEHAYKPEHLPYWTVGIRIKVWAQLPLGRVMNAISWRLGVRCPQIRFNLDGFFGMRGFADIFSNPHACPWMEVSSFSTVQSLHLKDADCIFVSVTNPAQILDVQEWRRKLMREGFKNKAIKEESSGTAM